MSEEYLVDDFSYVIAFIVDLTHKTARYIGVLSTLIDAVIVLQKIITRQPLRASESYYVLEGDDLWLLAKDGVWELVDDEVLTHQLRVLAADTLLSEGRPLPG